MADKIYSVKKTLRLTPAQNDELSVRAEKEGMNEAEYLRYLIMQDPENYPELQIMLRGVINHINDIKNNIFNIIYERESDLSKEDKEQLIAYLRKVDVSLKEVVKRFGNK